MIVYNNQAPDAVNNVGQFGATEGSIGAYKQAAEYAADSKYWALLAESKFGTIDDLIAEVERLYQQGVLMKQDIEDLKQDFKDQDARLMSLIAQTNAAVSDANNAVALINQKLIEVQNQLDVLLGMSVDVTTLPPGTPATGSFNPNTGVISLGIPEGDPGKDGSVKDLDTAPTGVPELGDLGFYVDKDDNTVHKTTLENIANLIPSVRSISINEGPALDGEVALTINKNTVGLGNVLNVAQYSRQEINDKFDKTTKTYQSKAEADADAQYRQVGEKVLVWEATKYEFYTVAANKTLTPVKTEGRILTVNSRSPDSSGNIDITIPTGNPSLYLGEMVMFPYDPTKNISYPGVLPADGRLVSKESASDLGPSLVSGQLPVVSETEWQSGSRQYFSWGKLADGITDADSTNFINIRLPDWTGGEAIRSPDSVKDSAYKGNVQSQVPYVVTVNNQAPDEITGNVNLSRSILGAASSGANSDITSLTGLTTALSIVQGGTGATDSWTATHNLKTFSQKTARFVPGDDPLDVFWSNSYGFLTGQYEQSLTGPWMDVTSFDNKARMQLIGFYGSALGTSGFAYKVFEPNDNTWLPTRIVKDSGNTTIDVNGFIKAASPIVDIFHDGAFKTNHEAEGVSVERTSVGEYLVTGCLGTNSDKGWGGVDGGFEIPLDRNKQPRIWLDYEVKEDGSILVKTYHREHPNAPKFAQNIIEGVSNGDPIDIPTDAFISVRVEMPSE